MGTPISEGVGGAIVGFSVKQGWLQKLPAIPIVGRMGTAAFLLHWWAKRGGGEYVRRAATAAAVIAGYQLGSTGSIMGQAESYGPPELDGDDDDE